MRMAAPSRFFSSALSSLAALVCSRKEDFCDSVALNIFAIGITHLSPVRHLFWNFVVRHLNSLDRLLGDVVLRSSSVLSFFVFFHDYVFVVNAILFHLDSHCSCSIVKLLTN